VSAVSVRCQLTSADQTDPKSPACVNESSSVVGVAECSSVRSNNVTTSPCPRVLLTHHQSHQSHQSHPTQRLTSQFFTTPSCARRIVKNTTAQGRQQFTRLRFETVTSLFSLHPIRASAWLRSAVGELRGRCQDKGTVVGIGKATIQH